jgi:hypothetical protein
MPWRPVGEWTYSSTILNLGTRWRWVASFTPLPLYPRGKHRPVPIVWKAGWTPEPVWRLWSWEISCPLSGIEPRHLGRPAHSVVTIPTAVSRLLIWVSIVKKLDVNVFVRLNWLSTWSKKDLSEDILWNSNNIIQAFSYCITYVLHVRK